jgi:hypothetical protein
LEAYVPFLETPANEHLFDSLSMLLRQAHQSRVIPAFSTKKWAIRLPK